jgi:Asp-tRNA(Asn)/Glu-tRNA(Gln) amidotransferase A subunit family amidase
MISLADLQRRIDAGDLSADAAIAQSLEATHALEKSIGAFVCHDPGARAQSAGPLRGIAVGIKDIMDTADFPTEMGSPIYRGHRSRGDAEAGGCDYRGQDHDHGIRLLGSDADAQSA